MPEANVRRRGAGNPAFQLTEPRAHSKPTRTSGDGAAVEHAAKYPIGSTPPPLLDSYEKDSSMRRCMLSVCLVLLAGSALAADPVTFPRTTIDLGCVVTDLGKSVRFYTEGIGFRELEGFEVPTSLATDAGLTDLRPLTIKVLALGDGPDATKLKLMQVAGTLPRTGDTEFIHSHTGFRYLTIMVEDTDEALARLEKLGVKPIAKSPVALPSDLGGGLFLTCVRDPDGNLVELIGPRKP
jgi:lactoylglutathione lyase